MKTENKTSNLKEEPSIAYLLLDTLKKDYKRMFIIAIIEAIIIISMFIGFLIYESQFETVTEGETTTVESQNGIATYL